MHIQSYYGTTILTESKEVLGVLAVMDSFGVAVGSGGAGAEPAGWSAGVGVGVGTVVGVAVGSGGGVGVEAAHAGASISAARAPTSDALRRRLASFPIIRQPRPRP